MPELATSKRQTAQTLETLNAPDALLRLPTVQVAVGLGRRAIYARIARGDFPRPVKLSARCARWRSRDVVAWIQSQGVAA